MMQKLSHNSNLSNSSRTLLSAKPLLAVGIGFDTSIWWDVFYGCINRPPPPVQEEKIRKGRRRARRKDSPQTPKRMPNDQHLPIEHIPHARIFAVELAVRVRDCSALAGFQTSSADCHGVGVGIAEAEGEAACVEYGWGAGGEGPSGGGVGCEADD